MPVEIKELIIRTVVEEQRPDGSSALENSGANSEKIIEACVRQVLRILKQSKER